MHPGKSHRNKWDDDDAEDTDVVRAVTTVTLSDSSLKPDNLFDNLIGQLNTSSFDSVLRQTWSALPCHTRYDHYGRQTVGCGSQSSFSDLQVESHSFRTAANMSRTGFVTPKQEEGNPNEFVFEGNMRIPVPIIRATVTVYGRNVSDMDATGNETSINLTAVSSRDIVMTVKFILNKRWNKIFVTDITTKENSVFRASFSCRNDMSYTFCDEIQKVLNQDVLTRIDSSMRGVLKFKFEEMEPDIS